MNFNSVEFLLFLPVVLIIYWLIPNRFRWMWLLAASYYFYMSWKAELIFLIVGTTLISYAAGLLLERVQKPGIRKAILISVIVTCIGLLLFFKYFNFLLNSVILFLNMFTLNLKAYSLDIILPIGISFYTFQTLSYVIDVYNGKVKAEKHLGYYALFVSFFPQLVAGPIERPGDLLPQLKAEHKLSREDFSVGFRILLVGFFLKCVVADYIGIYVNQSFAAFDEGKGNALSVFVMGFLFTVQMYCDFAGYAEIATGAARMMGVRLSRNFNRPELSQSYTDFFRRWHITLTRWFTDYVYIPLGGNRKGAFRKLINTYIVFLLCGLWHGANWTYVLWGLYAAFFLCLENILKKPVGNWVAGIGLDKHRKLVRGLSTCYTFLLLVPAGLIFRASSVKQVSALFKVLFTNWDIGSEYFLETMGALGLTLPLILQIIVFIVLVALVPRFAELGRTSPDIITKDSYKLDFISALMIIMIFLCWMGLLSFGGTSEFQYFQF